MISSSDYPFFQRYTLNCEFNQGFTWLRLTRRTVGFRERWMGCRISGHCYNWYNLWTLYTHISEYVYTYIHRYSTIVKSFNIFLQITRSRYSQVSTSRGCCKIEKKPSLGYAETCRSAFKNGPKCLRPFSSAAR